MRHSIRLPLALALATSALLASPTGMVEAGDRLFRRRNRPVMETVALSRPEDQLAPSPMLGSFRPTPYISVGRTSPLNMYGREQSLTVYGPLSAFRQTSAPVTTVVRGYDGLPTVAEGISFSNPNNPALSPFVYPNRASNYSAFRYQATPPRWDNGSSWIDHN